MNDLLKVRARSAAIKTKAVIRLYVMALLKFVAKIFRFVYFNNDINQDLPINTHFIEDQFQRTKPGY